MMTGNGRKTVWILIAAVFLGTAALSEFLRPGHTEYMRALMVDDKFDPRDPAGVRSKLAGTSFQTLMPTLLGIREVMASLMWVQADSYFHRGEYRPIIRMVRQITAIDPHQIDVYATGAWHMAYNFMDKRLIEDGVKFLEEGCKNNDNVYDLYFELGYMHYDKTKNYREAIRAYDAASKRGTTTGSKLPPAYVRHQLAHAYERMGDIDQSLVQWQKNIEVAKQQEAEGASTFGPAGPNTNAAWHNYYITSRRRNERLAALAEGAKNAPEALRLWQRNVALADEFLRSVPGETNVAKDRARAELEVERLRAGRLNPVQPANIEIAYTVKRIAPGKIEVAGTANVLDLSRMHVRFHDKDYQTRSEKFDFKMDNCTLEWDNVSVRQGKFRHLIDLARDPADMGRPPSDIYPLKADRYVLNVMYTPRLQAAFIQDRYGWSGERMTSKPELVKEDDSKAAIMFGKRYPLRTIETQVELTRDDILGKGQKVLHAHK